FQLPRICGAVSKFQATLFERKQGWRRWRGCVSDFSRHCGPCRTWSKHFSANVYPGPGIPLRRAWPMAKRACLDRVFQAKVRSAIFLKTLANGHGYLRGTNKGQGLGFFKHL